LTPEFTLKTFEQDVMARSAALTWWATVERLPEVQLAVEEGKMFGLLLGIWPQVSELPHGVSRSHLDSDWVELIACSGQLAGVWEPQGWAPSLLDHHRVSGESWRAQRDLHRLTCNIAQARRRGEVHQASELKRERRDRSHQYADVIRQATVLTPLVGDPLPLSMIWPGAATGVGECCAPKLICWAAQLGIRPVGLAEFQVKYTQLSYVPRAPKARLITQVNISPYELLFYTPCVTRCIPILPFLINGVVASSS